MSPYDHLNGGWKIVLVTRIVDVLANRLVEHFVNVFRPAQILVDVLWDYQLPVNQNVDVLINILVTVLR